MTEVCTTPAPTTLVPVECAPWCEVGTGHVDKWHPDDQYCSSEYREVFLSREPLVKMMDDGMQQDSILTYLCRDNGARAPHVVLVKTNRDGSDTAVEFTVSEWRQFLAAGQALADLADQGRGGTLSERLARAADRK